MTVRASALCTEIHANGATNYSASFLFSVFDEIAVAVYNGNISIQISYTLKPKKADDFIRQSIAENIFNGIGNSSTAGLVIDPDDIYIPFAR